MYLGIPSRYLAAKGELNENSFVALFMLFAFLLLATALHLSLSDKTAYGKPNHMFSGMDLFNAKVFFRP